MTVARRSLVLVGILMTAGAVRAADAVDLGGVTEKHVMVPMRDGKKLSVYLYFPEGKGPWPVIYEQRYADLRGAGTRKAFAKRAAAGYVVAAQNFRGTHQSEGTWVGYRALGWGELKDGYDTVEWLAAQPWSTGKVGTFGGSQGGFAQNFLAVAAPPHLVCQYMTDTGLSLFHEGYRIGGTTRPERFKAMEAVRRDPEDNRRLVREWFAHPTYDDYWAAEDCTRHFDKMNVPCFTLGSWFDFMCVGSVDSYVGRQHRGGVRSRGHQQLILGPWLHGGPKGNKIAEMVYPENAKFALDEHVLRWFDHYLKGKDNGVERDPAVRYYVMGAAGEKGAPGNEWRTARDWPVPSRTTPYYLHFGRRLVATPPAVDDGATTFTADPQHPAQLPGRAFPGAADAREFEDQPGVRTFTSDVLAAPVEWTGKVRAELWVSSTAKDADFIVRVSDVYPDGRSILLMDYVRRARYREGYEKEVLMEPGQVYQVAFDVGWVSQVFNKGHRIRVTVCGTGAPFYEPNPNTGEPLTVEPPKTTAVAKNTVYHNRRHASRILAPVARPVPEKPIRVADVLDGHVHPALCVTKKGTLLAVFNKSGGGGKELLLCRSTDGGKTWSKPEPVPTIKDCSIYPGSLTTLADGRVLLHWACYRAEGERRWRVPQYCLSADDGKTWGEPKGHLPIGDLTNYTCLRHPVLELSADEWVCPLYDRTVICDVKGGRARPFGDGRNHGMVPIVRTAKGTLVSGAPQADAAVPEGVPRDRVGGLRSTDGGKTWEALHALPYFGVAGYDLTALGNGWVVLTSIVYGVGEDGEWSYELIASRDDGKTWDSRHPVEVYNPGRRIAGRGWPRMVQIDRDTLGTLFYDLDAKQPGGPGMFFVRTPLASLDPVGTE